MEAASGLPLAILLSRIKGKMIEKVLTWPMPVVRLHHSTPGPVQTITEPPRVLLGEPAPSIRGWACGWVLRRERKGGPACRSRCRNHEAKIFSFMSSSSPNMHLIPRNWQFKTAPRLKKGSASSKAKGARLYRFCHPDHQHSAWAHQAPGQPGRTAS